VEIIEHKAIVVGGGLAGLRAALEMKQRGVDVALISMVHPVRSHSVAAQGGINAPLAHAEAGKDDNWERHAFDTVKGGDYLADQDSVEVLTKEASEHIYQLDRWGVPFSRMENGRIAQRPFGGGGFPRTCYATDKTGHYILHTLYERSLKEGLTVYVERFLLSIVVEDGKAQGLIVLNLMTGRTEAYSSGHIVLAAGGAGRIYDHSTNSLINTGAATVLAWHAGVTLKDMEFIQFHPTTLFGTNILISEGARGEGAYLWNNLNKRFMQDYAPNLMELAPRDIVARAMQKEIEAGRGFPGGYFHLDLRHLGERKIKERLPGIRELCLDFAGVDPVREPVPVQPGQHYTMGGIDTDLWGETGVKGIYAAGECACVSVHGANRLGGNSLLDCIVFGKRAGEKAALNLKEEGEAKRNGPRLEKALEEVNSRLRTMLQSKGMEDPASIRDSLRSAMFRKVGIFREKAALAEALDEVRTLRERYRSLRPSPGGMVYNLDFMRSLELEGQLELAEIITIGALAREESRGSHSRRDFSQRDDVNWLRHTMARYTDRGPVISYSPVRLTKWPPQERQY